VSNKVEVFQKPTLTSQTASGNGGNCFVFNLM